MKKDIPLSVIIITKNEEINIKRCLESVKWANEIIVIDSHSTDKTVSICKNFTTKVYSKNWPGFGIQKNRALSLCTNDWILSIDADEVIPKPLQEEIINVISKNNSYDGYYIRRISNYCGKFLKYGDWKKDYIIRLFKRKKGKFSNSKVHEEVLINGKTAKLKETFLHYAFSDIEEVLDTLNRYTTMGAIQKEGKSSGIIKAVSRAFWTFFRGYILKTGFLDGKEGFLLAVSNAEGTYYKYIKLIYINKK
ncbi:MAG: glycosyltransferase family 2 protein [Spirochaetia bacterium]|nr:glycosyltransferase family 2 protein [Spirochaetia bacterium]